MNIQARLDRSTIDGAHAITIAALTEKLAKARHATIRPGSLDSSSSIGIGRYDVESVREGLSLVHFDVRYTRSVDIRAEYRPSVFVGMLLKGRHSTIVDGNAFSFDRLHAPILFSVGRQADAYSVQRAGEDCAIIGMMIEPDFIARNQESFAGFELLLGEAVVHREFVSGELLRCLLVGLLECPYAGAMRRLHRESQALALAAELGRQLESEFDGHGAIFNRTRRERAEHARLLIEHSLAQPPSLSEIAREVGSNETSLRLDFKALYGKTIFEYLRDRRLDIARLLVQERAGSIAEIAYRCGYSSPANFTTAYRRRFGVPPSQD